MTKIAGQTYGIEPDGEIPIRLLAALCREIIEGKP